MERGWIFLDFCVKLREMLYFREKLLTINR